MLYSAQFKRGLFVITQVLAVSEDSVAHAANILLEGGVVCIPTDTVYGLAACAEHPGAVEKIFEIKNRPFHSPIPVLLNSQSQICKFVDEFPPSASGLADQFWPGALTIILRKSSLLPDVLTSGLKTAAFRVPDHDVPRVLCKAISSAITGTSANKSGSPPATNAEEAFSQLKGSSVDLILDGGVTNSRVPSSIIDCSETPPRLIRGGIVLEQELKRIIGNFG